MKSFTAVLTLVVFAAFAPTVSAQTPPPANPCEDDLYLLLKEKKIDDMSEREYDLFKTRDAACSEWRMLQTKVQSPPANTGTTAATGATSDFLQGITSGESAGESVGTGGSMVGGLAGGLLLGLIGTGIAYVAQSKPDVPEENTIQFRDYSSDFQMGYRRGYIDTVHKKKKSSALAGGLIGTAAFVLIVVSSGS